MSLAQRSPFRTLEWSNSVQLAPRRSWGVRIGSWVGVPRQDRPEDKGPSGSASSLAATVRETSTAGLANGDRPLGPGSRYPHV